MYGETSCLRLFLGESTPQGYCGRLGSGVSLLSSVTASHFQSFSVWFEAQMACDSIPSFFSSLVLTVQFACFAKLEWWSCYWFRRQIFYLYIFRYSLPFHAAGLTG